MAKHDTARFCVGVLTMALQLAVALWPPEVTVTVATFEPAVEYVFEVDAPLAEKPSVPTHVYAYEPLPPEAVADQLIGDPRFTELGEAEQEADKVGSGTVVVQYGPSLCV